MAMPGAQHMNPQPWRPGMGGPPPPDFRQGQGPPMGGGQMGPPPSHGPPPMQGLPSFGGYEQAGGFGQMQFMPPPPPPPPPANPPPQEFTDIANLNEESCRQAMLQHVSEHCCYGSKPAQEMNITSVKGLTALHYILETFTESRQTGWASEPYRGGLIDGPENGPPPPPWAIPCVADSMFNTHTKYLEVPHTATVRPCHVCDARGYLRCHRCHGWGQVTCNMCHGSGRREERDPHGNPYMAPCHFCGGDGKTSCHTCGGDGMITCTECDGFKNLKSFLKLTVSFVNHEDDHIVERSDLPDQLVAHVKGEIVFEQCLPQVPPIIAYPVKEVNDNSVRLVNSHRSAFPNERQLQQRQRLRAVPVTECGYTWDDVNTRFWVYGLERRVHAPDYPQQCCWGCSIL